MGPHPSVGCTLCDPPSDGAVKLQAWPSFAALVGAAVQRFWGRRAC